MANFTQTVELNVWKEHICACCACKYRYLFRRKKAGQGTSPERAVANAEKAVVRALANEIDVQPCPDCGLYQPDMVAVRRSHGHWLIFFLSIVPVALVIILAAAEAISLAAAAYLAAALYGMVWIAHLAFCLYNPNRNLAANQALGERKKADGEIWVPEESRPDPDAVPPSTATGMASYFVLLLMLGCVLSSLLAPMLSVVNHWPVNSSWVPNVAGPGDEAYVYFPNKIVSVKGYWNGQASATATCKTEPALQVGKLTARTQTDVWPQTIQVDNKSSSTSTKALWVKVGIPGNSDLVGKTLTVQMSLAVRYPKLMDATHFDDNFSENFTYSADLTLAKPGAGAVYRACWYAGVIGGGLAMIVLGAFLALIASTLRRKALPTEVFVPEGQ